MFNKSQCFLQVDECILVFVCIYILYFKKLLKGGADNFFSFETVGLGNYFCGNICVIAYLLYVTFFLFVKRRKFVIFSLLLIKTVLTLDYE